MNQPRILLLADIDSVHTQKWALGLSQDNIRIGIFSLNHSKSNWYQNSRSIECLWQPKQKQSHTTLSKLNYLFSLPLLLIQILKFRPNIVHSHYASSYGLLGALTFFKSFIVSAWGSDILEFPRQGRFQKLILKFVFWRAKQICVTSSVLEKEVLLYTNKKCHVIPFGINLNDFYASAIQKQPHPFTYGCIKHFEKIYNIDKVVEAYHLLIEKYPRETFKLKLVGDGSEKQKIYKLAEQFGLTNKIEFTNRIEHNQVPMHLNQIDVLLNVSEYESFGVAVAEAMACKIPVIVSNSEGFKDLVPNKDYAIIVSSITPEIICNAMEEYFVNAEKRKSVVKKSYELIIEKFNWINNLKQMEEVYLEFLPNLNPQ